MVFNGDGLRDIEESTESDVEDIASYKDTAMIIAPNKISRMIMIDSEEDLWLNLLLYPGNLLMPHVQKDRMILS